MYYETVTTRTLRCILTTYLHTAGNQYKSTCQGQLG